MKYILILLLFVDNSICYSQSTENKNYNIHFDSAEKFPAELLPLKDWLAGNANKLSFSLKSFKSSPNEDAGFKMFALRLGKRNVLPIGNSGNFLVLGADSIGLRTINVEHEWKWKIKAYQPNYDLNKFEAHNNDEIFFTSTLIYNISEEQALAHFINSYVSGNQKSKLKTLADDLFKKYEIKLDVKDNDNISLTDFAKEISAKTKLFSSYVCYRLYLEDKDYKKECQNLRGYYQKFVADDVINNFLDKVTPEGKFALRDTLATLVLSGKGFTIVDKNNKKIPDANSSLSIRFKDLSYKIMYDRKKDYEPFLKLDFGRVTILDSCLFNINDEEKYYGEMFAIFPFKELSLLNSNNITSVSMYLYKKSITLKMTIKGENDNVYEYTVSEEKIKYE